MKSSRLILLMFSVFFVFSSALIVGVVHYSTSRTVFADAHDRAVQIIDQAESINSYVAEVMRPAVFERLSVLPPAPDYFDPQWMSASYIIRQLHSMIPHDVKDAYSFKMFAVNARVEYNEADDYEMDVYDKYSDDADLGVTSELRTIDGVRTWVVYKRNVYFEERCMKCHGTPQQAPADLVNLYGPERGFNRVAGDLSAVLSVRIPVETQLGRVQAIVLDVSFLLLTIFGIAMFVMLTYMRKAFISPLFRLSGAMTDISADEEKIGTQVAEEGTQEMIDLARSFNTVSTDLRAMRDNLVHLVDEKTEELRTINRTLEEKVDEETRRRLQSERFVFEQKKFIDMGRMISAIAHQWRQPLNALGLHVQDTCLTGMEQGVDVDFFENKQADCMRLLNHMSQTINDFRDFFKPDRERESFDVIDAAVSTFRMAAPQIEALGIECLIHVTSDSGEWEWHPNRQEAKYAAPKLMLDGFEGEMKQVFMNLLQNATDAVKARMEADDSGAGSVVCRVNVFDSHIEIRFIDTGTGLLEEAQERMFEPYFTTKGSNGTGIGLFMSRTIVEKHFGGSLTAENDDNGAVLKVTLDRFNEEDD